MKRCLAMLVALLLPVAAMAEGIDLSGMSLADLIALREQITMAMWQTDEWQEVTVPQGVYQVGVDIPAGTWTVRCADLSRDDSSLQRCEFSWGKSLNDSGTGIQFKDRLGLVSVHNPQSRYYDEGDITDYTFTVQVGDYIVIDPFHNRAVFTPYAGKPDLGFK